jgi:cellulose biosynthesis protein BcsQ
LIERAVTGEIVTFYSYKGGTGRSMLLANAAWILACNGKRVLAIDWDLEAPGLHRYFAPFLLDRDLTSSDGVIDFVIDFSLAALSAPPDAEEPFDASWFLPYANILRYAVSLDWEFPQGGALDFVGAGRQGPSYSTRVNSYDWQGFYDRFGGGTFLEEMKRLLKESYDYVLVDSRTGVSDTSGICTLQLPDTLVVCFTLNNQSIEGSAAVAESVEAQRRAGEPVRILPVPMRVENSEKVKLGLRKRRARERFGRFPAGLRGAKADRYWADVEVVYVPFYAYEEILATFGDRTGERHTILASAERITGVLTNGEVDRTVRPSEGRRLEVLASYEGTLLEIAGIEEGVSGGTIYISYRRTDASGHAARLYDDLSQRLGPERVFIDVDSLSPGVDFVDAIERAVATTSVVLVVIGPDWLGSANTEGRRRIDDPDDYVRSEVEAALRSDTRVIPTLVGGARPPSSAELPAGLAPLARRQSIELSDDRWSYDIDRLYRTLDVALTVDRVGMDVATSTVSASRAQTARSYESEDAVFDLLEAQRRLDRVKVWGRVVGAVIGVAAIGGLLYLGYQLVS